MERVDRFELEAARFDDVQRLGCRVADLRAQRRADIAADGHFEPGSREHPSGQRRRRRFAFGSRDGDHAALQPAGGELDLRDHRHTAIARRDDRRLFERHAGTEHDQVGAGEGVRLVSAELEPDAQLTQPVAPGKLRPCIGQRDAGATDGEQLRGGQSASRRAGDRHPFSVDREIHRSFNVVRLNSAKMIAMITNRAITFGSLHPISSKW